MYKNRPFQNYTPITGKSAKQKFDEHVTKVKKKHNLANGTEGYECHPDYTKYDKLVISMLNEIKAEEDKKAFLKKKHVERQSSMLSYEKEYCPLVAAVHPNKPPVPKELNEESDSAQTEKFVENENVKDTSFESSAGELTQEHPIKRLRLSTNKKKSPKKKHEPNDFEQRLISAIKPDPEVERIKAEAELMKAQAEVTKANAQEKQAEAFLTQSRAMFDWIQSMRNNNSN